MQQFASYYSADVDWDARKKVMKVQQRARQQPAVKITAGDLCALGN
jgi:hypothetical protein